MRNGKSYLGIICQRRICDKQGSPTDKVEERFYLDQQRPKIWAMDEYRRLGYALFVAWRVIPATAQKRLDANGTVFYSWKSEIDADSLRRDKSKQEYYQRREEMTRAQAEAHAAQARIEREEKKRLKAQEKKAEKATAKKKAAPLPPMSLAEALGMSKAPPPKPVSLAEALGLGK